MAQPLVAHALMWEALSHDALDFKFHSKAIRSAFDSWDSKIVYTVPSASQMQLTKVALGGLLLRLIKKALIFYTTYLDKTQFGHPIAS